MWKRSTISKVGPGATVTTTTVALGAPSWAQAVILHIKATTAAASTLDVSLVLDSQDGEGTAISLVAADQIAASGTDVQRYLAIGTGVASLAGTNVDSLAFPLSSHMGVLLTVAGTVTDVDIYAEFVGF